MQNVFLFSFLVLLVQCGPARQTSPLQTVHGELDTRRDVNSLEAPYSFIGRIDSGCTGTLIGPRLMVTSLHCLLNAEGDKDWRDDVCYFRPQLQGSVNGRLVSPDRALPTRMWYMQAKSEGAETKPDVKADRGQDWAIVELDKDLGKRNGYFAVNQQSFFSNDGNQISMNKLVRFLGYSTDVLRLNEKNEVLPLINGNRRRDGYTASEDPSCLITNYAFQTGDPNKRYLLHNCKETRGASGGPLFHRVGDGYELVAIQGADFPGDDYQSEYIKPGSKRPPNANVAVPAEHFASVHQTLSEILDLTSGQSTEELLNYVRLVVQEQSTADPLLELKVRSITKGPKCEDAPRVPTYKQVPTPGPIPVNPPDVLPPPKEATSTGPLWQLGITYSVPPSSPYRIRGIYINKVIPGGPADFIGLCQGDYIEAINGKHLHNHFLQEGFWTLGSDGEIKELKDQALTSLLMQTNGVVDVNFLRLTPYGTWQRISKKRVRLVTKERVDLLIAEQERRDQEAQSKLARQQLRNRAAKIMLNGNVALIAYNDYVASFGYKTFTASSLGRITVPANYGYNSIGEGCTSLVFMRVKNVYKYGMHPHNEYYQDHLWEGSPDEIAKKTRQEAERKAVKSCQDLKPPGATCFDLVSVCSTY